MCEKDNDDVSLGVATHVLLSPPRKHHFFAPLMPSSSPPLLCFARPNPDLTAPSSSSRGSLRFFCVTLKQHAKTANEKNTSLSSPNRLRCIGHTMHPASLGCRNFAVSFAPFVTPFCFVESRANFCTTLCCLGVSARRNESSKSGESGMQKNKNKTNKTKKKGVAVWG